MKSLTIITLILLALLSIDFIFSVRRVSGEITFENFYTPEIIPHAKGILSFEIRNKYNSSIENATLILEIYRYCNIEESKDIKDIFSPPIFETTNSNIAVISNFKIEKNSTKRIDFVISTTEKTPEGTYFVGSRINYTYNNITYEHYSIGYHPTINQKNFFGIIPETSFTVKSEKPYWILYSLIVFGIILGIVGIIFYFQENKHAKI